MKQTYTPPVSKLTGSRSIITAGGLRCTLLTKRLLRLEFSPGRQFEDRPSQVFWFRDLPTPEFELREDSSRTKISTDCLECSWEGESLAEKKASLKICVKETGAVCQLDAGNPANLLGTTRTLDNSAGWVELEQGLASRSGWAVYDDSQSLVFTREGELVSREAGEGCRDLYFFGHGLDYQAALSDFSKVAGKVPLVPRWALGNWWSRFWAYSDEELLTLMDAFREREIPLSVCVVDMDWHITETGNDSSGWTGYTWNRELFPEPEEFLAELHRRGLKVALNLHPAEGIHSHEDSYKEICLALGRDPQAGRPIDFDVEDPAFVEAYFSLLHRPLEKQGVDFWWLDWQQGELSGIKDLDPLWWLNHNHYHDLASRKQDPLIFSRWSGLGSHRYPLGFSGDALVSWSSLAFQPYFTATAANVNYGWWSHDIGGHMGGIEDPELYTRWVQFGVFSPIFRLHSGKNRYHERRPWGYNPEVKQITSRLMRLRQQLIPYLYTMAYRSHREDIPLVRSMYHEWPKEEQAYHCPDQYLFGSELLAAPYLIPRDHDTRLSRQVVWLPKGEWFDYFSGLQVPRNSYQAVYGGLGDVPLFARAGAILPLAADGRENTLEIPESLDVQLFPLADGEFQLIEDDGRGAVSELPIVQSYSPQSWRVTIGPAEGERGHLPAERSIRFSFRGLEQSARVSAEQSGEPVDLEAHYLKETMTLVVSGVRVKVGDQVTVELQPKEDAFQVGGNYQRTTFQKLLQQFRLDSWVKEKISLQEDQLLDDPQGLEPYLQSLTDTQRKALIETLTGVGRHVIKDKQGNGLIAVAWNNEERSDAEYALTIQDTFNQPHFWKSEVPRYLIIRANKKAVSIYTPETSWERYFTADDWVRYLRDLPPELVEKIPQGSIRLILTDHSPEEEAWVFLGGKKSGERENQNRQVNIRVAEPDFLSMVNQEMSMDELQKEGKIQISGDLQWIQELALLFSIPSLVSFCPETLSVQMLSKTAGYYAFV